MNSRMVLCVLCLIVCVVNAIIGVMDEKPVNVFMACMWAFVAGMYLANTLIGVAS